MASTCYGQVQANQKKSNIDEVVPVSGILPSIENAGNEPTLNNPQNYSIKRSNVGLGGFSGLIISGGGKYKISQSIGQSSAIGTYINDGYTLIQGFQEPFGLPDKLNLPEQTPLRSLVYPNPFYHSVNIQIVDPVESDILIAVFDTKGMLMHTDKVPAAQLILLHLNELPDGHYILKVRADNKQFATNIIKQ